MMPACSGRCSQTRTPGTRGAREPKWPRDSLGSAEQFVPRLAVLQHVLRLAVVVSQGCGGVDPENLVQRCQHVLHPDRLADDALAAGIGGANDLAGLQAAAGHPEETSVRPVT